MTDATIEELKQELVRIDSEQASLRKKIEALESVPAIIRIPTVEIHLNRGERYAGIMLNSKSIIHYYLILLPGEAESMTWRQAVDWARNKAGYLPAPREQALLYANLPGEFKGEWYWSGLQHASNEHCAWTQYFGDGTQDHDHKIDRFRARAVRRVYITEGGL